MTSTSRLCRYAAVAAVASLALAACGDDNEPTAADTGPTGAATSKPTGGTESPVNRTCKPDAAAAQAPLTIGALLPQSGSLAFLGPPMTTGATLAVKDINAGGGINDADVVLKPADEGDANLNIVGQSAASLLNQNVSVILGAAATGMSQLVYSQITGACVLQISPSNTGVEVSGWETGGMYFRTAPSDVLQGEILGDVILEDGNETVGILYLDSPYGSGLSESISQTVEAGGVDVVYNEAFSEQAENYSAEVAGLAAANPDAIVVISYDQIYSIIPELQRNFDDLSHLYLVDGNTKDLSVGPDGKSPGLDPGTVAGATGTIPGQSVEGSEFGQRLLQVTSSLDSYTYAGEAYDAIILAGLAAIQAKSSDGAAIAAQMADVSGNGGQQCSSFADCRDLIEAGTDIDYEGISGPIEFADNGDPQSAFIGIYKFDDNNVPQFQESRTLDVAAPGSDSGSGSTESP
jgi:branched-chain amino acid transport system substrate-binding protein